MKKMLAALLAVILVMSLAPLALAEETIELKLFYPVNVDGPLVALIETICAEIGRAHV